MLCAENAAPYAYSMEGAPSGMLVSILRNFAGKAGLDLEYTFCSDRESTREMLLSGDYDVFVGVHLTSGLCAQLGFINSAAVIQTTLAYAQSPTKSLPADERDITIALVRGLEEQISTAGYKAVVLCDDAEGCIQTVESGKADVAAADRASLMDSRRLRFECRLDDGPDCILVDRLRFNQIFLNLLSNAAQYTPTGG